MLSPGSRYFGTPVATLIAADGRPVRYLTRRLVPPPERFATLGWHRVAAGERVDALAARLLDDPEQFWQLADANGVLDPAELVVPGRRVRTTLPEGVPGDRDV